MKRIAALLTLLAGLIGPTAAQAPAPVPALPDAPRISTYTISGSQCICSVGFALYGDGTDVDNWIQVFIGPAPVLSTDPVSGWSLSSPSGSLGSIARPITDAVLTFNGSVTGTVTIVGARRPRRTTQFQEGRGVASRDLNQAITDEIAMLREGWDLGKRSIVGQPGETLTILPKSASRVNTLLGFDANGQPTLYPSASGLAVAAPGSIGNNLLANMNARTIKCNPNGFSSAPQDCTPAQAGLVLGRTPLSAPTTFYISLTGNDATGNGSLASPWRHLQYAYQQVQQFYDIAGQTVTFQSVDSVGTYPDCFLAAGPLLGSPGPGNVIINMNGTTVQGDSGSNCSNGNPFTFSANFGGGFVLENVTMSVCGTWNQDMVNIGQGSTVYIGPGVTYGCAFQPWNHNSVNGSLFINDSYTIQATNITTTGTWSNGGNTIVVASAANIRTFYGATGSGIPSNCFVASIVGTTITMASDINGLTGGCVFTGSGAGSPITFNSGANGHWGVGTFGLVECQNNNVPGVLQQAISGTPFFFYAYAYALQLSQINCGGITYTIGTAGGPEFQSQGNSVVYSHGMGVGYFPGDYNHQGLTINTTAGSQSATLSAGGQPYVMNGAAINDLNSATTCNTTMGSGVISLCTNASNCFAGEVIINTSGVPTGAQIASVAPPLITLVAGQAATATQVGITVNCAGHYIAPGTTIIGGGSGTSLVLSQPALASGTGIPVIIGGFTSFGGQFQ